LVQFNAGVKAHIDRVRLLIEGVQARVILEARLGNLVKIVGDVLNSLDLNPIIATLANDINKVVNNTVGVIGGPPPGSKSNRIEARSLRIEQNILYSVNDYSGNTHTNRVLAQNGEIYDEYLDNHGHKLGEDVVGFYERDMTFNGHNMSVSRNGQVANELEYVYDPFPGLSVTSAIYITSDGKVIGTQVISELIGGGTSSIEQTEIKRKR